MRKRLLLLAWLPLAACLPDARAVVRDESGPPLRFSEIARRFAQIVPKEHLLRIPLDDGTARRAWTNYLSSLDYERVYFTASDAARLGAEKSLLDDELEDGELGFAFHVYRLFQERLSNRCEYVNGLLERGFDLEKEESYLWQRRDASWPEAGEEWDELWRKKIKNEYVQRVVSLSLPAQSGNDDETAEPVTPEAFIRNRYRQLLTVIQDSDAESVLQHYLSAFARAYDPHSEYMSPSTVEDFEIEMKLSLVGIGALLRAEDGAAKIVQLIPGGPAARDTREKRLMPGDKIVAVAQGDEEAVDTLHWPLHKVVRLIRGEKGTRVVLTVVPASDPTGMQTKKVDLMRDEVKLEQQAAAWESRLVAGDDGVTRRLGVLRLPTFYADLSSRSRRDAGRRSSTLDVEQILEEMEEKNIEGVLLDLRSNGGGSLVEAIRMSGLFLRAGPVVQVQDRYSVRTLYDRDRGIAYAGPLVVLVNRLSASASEILAAALQDYGRAVIVGDSHTHGKGTVQTILGIGRDKGMGSVKITTGSYFRITGRSTQLEGVSADVVVPSPFDYMDLGEDSLPNAISCSVQDPVAFRRAGFPDSLIPILRQNSEKRRAQDPLFTAYAQVLAGIRAINESLEFPLEIDRRRKLAETERKLRQLQDELSPAAPGAPDPDQDADRDLVLAESLRILADLVTLQAQQTPVPPETGGFDWILEWLGALL